MKKITLLFLSFIFMTSCNKTREIKINGETIAFRNFGTNVLDQQPEPFTGIKEIRHLGYGRLENIRIVSDTPTPFKLLSIENEVQSK